MDDIKQKIHTTMYDLSRDTKLDAFIFFGGYPIDCLSGLREPQEINDFDIAIQGIEVRLMKRYESAVTESGYNIITARRPYVIQRTEHVFTTFAQKGNVIIDANFMKDPTKVGLFNIDSLYFLFPELELVDRFNCLEGIKSKKITPIRGLDNESPYFLAARFIYLSAKYDINMLDPKNRDVADQIVRNMHCEPVDQRGEFNSFLSSVFKSILKSRKKQDYLNALVELEFLKPRLSELEDAIKKILANHRVDEVQNCVNVNDLVGFLMSYMSNDFHTGFLKKIKPLYDRKWEKGNRRLDANLIERL